jgi:hypothetical protein
VVPSETDFRNSSTASNAALVAARGRVPGDSWGEIDFWDQSTAENAVITVESGANGGVLRINGNSTAENAHITNGGLMQFSENSSAGNATIVLEGETVGSYTSSVSVQMNVLPMQGCLAIRLEGIGPDGPKLVGE